MIRPSGRPGTGALDLDAVLLRKLLNAALRVDKLSLTGVERMAFRADLHPDVVASRPGHECFPAGAGDRGLLVAGVNALLHRKTTSAPRRASSGGGANCNERDYT